jgi:hypothetical protein
MLFIPVVPVSRSVVGCCCCYLVAPTIAAWQSLLRVALACSGDVASRLWHSCALRSSLLCSFPVVLGSHSLSRCYLVAPTIAAWRSLLRVALAVGAAGGTGLSVRSEGYCGSGTPVLSAVLVDLLWRWIALLCLLVVVEAVASCRSSVVAWKMLRYRWESMGVVALAVAAPPACWIY